MKRLLRHLLASLLVIVAAVAAVPAPASATVPAARTPVVLATTAPEVTAAHAAAAHAASRAHTRGTHSARSGARSGRETSPLVIPRLDRGIHAQSENACCVRDMDARVEPGHDEGEGVASTHGGHHATAPADGHAALAAAGASEDAPPCPDGPPACCTGGLCPMMHCGALPLVHASAGIRHPRRPAYGGRTASAIAGVAATRLFRPPIAAA